MLLSRWGAGAEEAQWMAPTHLSSGTGLSNFIILKESVSLNLELTNLAKLVHKPVPSCTFSTWIPDFHSKPVIGECVTLLICLNIVYYSSQFKANHLRFYIF